MSPTAKRRSLIALVVAMGFILFCVFFVEFSSRRRLYSHCTACGMEHYKTFICMTIFGSTIELENGMDVQGQNSMCPHSLVRDD